jgi:hypothetical protein
LSELPKIATAIPQRRFQYGDYGVTVLGDIESADGRDYQFIAAFVREGESSPRLYVVSERTPPEDRPNGSNRLRVVNAAMDEIMDIDMRWSRLTEFTEQALQTGAQILGLDRETPFPLG